MQVNGIDSLIELSLRDLLIHIIGILLIEFIHWLSPLCLSDKDTHTNACIYNFNKQIQQFGSTKWTISLSCMSSWGEMNIDITYLKSNVI